MNAKYYLDGVTGYGCLIDGTHFIFDAIDYDKIKNTKWYLSYQGGRPYLVDRRGGKLHSKIVDCPSGYEVDHINLDTLDNRHSNLRICTHQQNQINQPLQRNNTSGICGVSWYAPRNKYRARIKICQHDIHLGYYSNLVEAIQARNVGMAYMFGEYGRYNDVPPAPKWLYEKVIAKCESFANLSVCEAFSICKGRV